MHTHGAHCPAQNLFSVGGRAEDGRWTVEQDSTWIPFAYLHSFLQLPFLSLVVHQASRIAHFELRVCGLSRASDHSRAMGRKTPAPVLKAQEKAIDPLKCMGTWHRHLSDANLAWQLQPMSSARVLSLSDWPSHLLYQCPQVSGMS